MKFYKKAILKFAPVYWSRNTKYMLTKQSQKKQNANGKVNQKYEIRKFESSLIYLLYHTLLDHLMGNLKFY